MKRFFTQTLCFAILATSLFVQSKALFASEEEDRYAASYADDRMLDDLVLETEQDKQRRATYTTLSLKPYAPLAGEDYALLKAQEKQALLWKRIHQHPDNLADKAVLERKSQDPSTWNLTSLFNAFFLKTTFTHFSDEMPAGRKKLIHTYGSAGMVKFLPTRGNPFTGIFQEEVYGIARFSLAKQRPKETDTFTPGMGLKFLIDSQQSESIVAMYSLDGQGHEDLNFFSHSFSTAIEDAKTLPKLLGVAFEGALKLLSCTRLIRPVDSRTIPLERLANFSSKGGRAPGEDVVYPYALVFEPTPEVQRKIQAQDGQDYRIQLARLDAGDKVYEVKARMRKGDHDDALVHVGSLVLLSKLVSSDYEDEKLFMTHPARIFSGN